MCRDLPSWLAPESDLWAATRAARGETVGFRNIACKQHIVPAGPWPDDERLKAIGMTAGRAWERIWTSMEAPLQIFGQDAASARRIVRGAVADIRRRDVALAVKYHAVYAFKI
jgi:hypothetical protein